MRPLFLQRAFSFNYTIIHICQTLTKEGEIEKCECWMTQSSDLSVTISAPNFSIARVVSASEQLQRRMHFWKLISTSCALIVCLKPHSKLTDLNFSVTLSMKTYGGEGFVKKGLNKQSKQVAYPVVQTIGKKYSLKIQQREWNCNFHFRLNWLSIRGKVHLHWNSIS